MNFLTELFFEESLKPFDFDPEIFVSKRLSNAYVEITDCSPRFAWYKYS